MILRTISFSALIMALLSLCSCEKQEAAGYNRLSIQLLTEAFNAVHKQEHDLAVSRLAKLGKHEFINKMIIREKEGLVVQKTGELLKAGDLEKAAAIIEAGLVECGHNPQLTNAREIVDGLRYIRTYKTQRPFKDGVTADTMVNGLPQPKLFKNNVAYITWLNVQKKERDELKQRIQKQQAGKLMTQIDHAVLNERGKYGLLLAKLNKVIPKHPLYTSVLTGKIEDGLSQQEKEILWTIQFKKSPSFTVTDNLAKESKTRCGRFLSLVRELKRNKRIEALAILRELIEKQPTLDPTLINHALALSKVETDGRNLSIPSILEAIYNLER